MLQGPPPPSPPSKRETAESGMIKGKRQSQGSGLLKSYSCERPLPGMRLTGECPLVSGTSDLSLHKQQGSNLTLLTLRPSTGQLKVNQ